MSGLEQRYCIVTGRVQRVGFRAFVIEAARSLGVNGWVRNQADGRSVAVMAEGSAEALDRLVEQLRHGPPGARVERIECSTRPATGLDGGFVVQRQ